jgi:hemerythrin superfamily protein
MASDAVTLIKNDHRLMEKLFEQLKSGRGDRRALLEEVAARLTAHSHAEEQKVYPALAKAEPEEAAEVGHSVDEHHEAERLLHRVQRTDPDDASFDQALTELVDAVMHHVEEEENEILPKLQEAVDRQTLEKLGEEFEEVRARELAGAGFDEARQGGAAGGGQDRGGRGTSAGATAPGDMTREQLYAQAKEAEIPGRSSMTKDELARALRERG